MLSLWRGISLLVIDFQAINSDSKTEPKYKKSTAM